MDTKQNQQLYSVNKEDQDQFLASNFLYSSGSIILSEGKSKLRFLMLILMMIAFELNAVCYELDNIGTPDYLYYIEPFFFVVLFMSSIRWIEEWGLYRTMLFAMVLQTFGLWFGRSLNSDIFGTNLVGPTVGEFFNSAANVFLFNSITKFTGLWFGYRERVIATMFLIISFYCGSYTTDWFFKTIPADISVDDIISKYLQPFWLASAIINFIMFLIFAIAFRAAPQQIPSRSQQVRGNPFNFRAQIQELLEEKENKIYLIICAFLLTYCFCSPYNFEYFAFDSLYDLTPNSESTWLEIVDESVEPYVKLVGAIVFGIFLALTQKYKLVLLIIIGGNLVTTFLCEISMLTKVPLLYAITYSIQDFLIGGTRVLVYELVTEFSYPQSAALAVGVLHLMAKPCILALTVVSDNCTTYYTGDDSQYIIFNHIVQFLFVAGLGVSFALTAKFELKTPRLEVDCC